MSTLASAISDLSGTLNERYGIETVEGTLFEIVDMLRENPNLKAQFLEMVEQTFSKRWPYALGENGVPAELIELTTHELKWPEFEVLANKRIQEFFGEDEILAINDVAHKVKEAYAEDWEDREFFERYAA
jgi:cell division FtsZ-interacting protein ZapD